jgi:hypothetical protein
MYTRFHTMASVRKMLTAIEGDDHSHHDQPADHLTFMTLSYHSTVVHDTYFVILFALIYVWLRTCFRGKWVAANAHTENLKDMAVCEILLMLICMI